jgi:DNA-directed RNA polymerase subunit RPC12/RpoP
MAIPSECFVCGQGAQIMKDDLEDSHVQCNRCGNYIITRELKLSPPRSRSDAYILSGVLRHASGANRVLKIGTDNMDALISNAPVPQDPIGSIDALLLLAYDKTK